MPLFVDASALVAIIIGEADGDRLASRIRDNADALCSPMSCWETISALHHSYRLEVTDARRRVMEIVAVRPLRLVPIGEHEMAMALDAYEIYGKGRHPAKLNMGDCFAYACAKANDAELLYKGNDFAKTDLA